MRNLVGFAVRRRVTVWMTTLAVLAFGLVGYSRLALEMFPDIAYPSLTVQTEFPNTAPQEVENLVTRPVEEAVGVLRGLQSIHSVSRAGVSEVTLEFDWGSDMDSLAMEVREKLDRLVLPEDSEEPIVLRFDPSLDPIMRLALAGTGELTEMRDLADRRIKQDFETIKGVAAAQVQGGLEQEIQIEVDQERLAAHGIPLEQIRALVGGSNLNLPGGMLRGRESQYLVRTVNEFDDVEEIRELIIARVAGAFVKLRDVAAVRMGVKDREVITRVNGKESVEIALYKEGDANTVTVAELLREKLALWRGKLPPGHELLVVFDQSRFVRDAVNGVRDAALLGGALAVLVLYAFLRDLRSTLIVAASIPVSVVATFMVMYRADISLNIMSLGGLTLGIGMLVDNSIVVLESIFRRRQEGADLTAAAVEGTVEVGPAVVASTLTTVAVFLPIVFVEGVAGQLFRDQALTVTISLLASLAVAITLIPMLSAGGSEDRATGAAEVAPAGGSGAAPTLGPFSRAYDRFARGVVRYPYPVIALAAILFLVSLSGLRLLDTELIPELSEGEFYFEVRLAEGSSLTATDRVISGMEASAAAVADVDRYYATVGSRLVTGGLSLNTKGENLGQLNVIVKDRTNRAAEERVAALLREQFAGVPDLDVKFGRPSYFSLRTPIEVVVYGEELEPLRDYAADLASRLARLDGLVDVRSSLEAGNPEIQVVFDRARLASLDLDMAALSETLRARVQGVVPTRFNVRDRQIDVRIRNLEDYRSSYEDIRTLVVPGPGGAPLRLLEVADIALDRGPAEIHRLQQQRAAVITANLQGRSLGSAINAIESLVDDLGTPAGLTSELSGQNREMEVSFRSLRFAIALAIFMVYLVMASTFESFIHPFVVLCSVPLSLIGVVGGLLLTGTSISVIVLIGCVMLVGIVVNNAIVLIDTVNRLRRRGLDKAEALVRAGHLRLRPILMTTLTTVLGLAPMAFSWGEGAELRAPLAITVASGLTLSTLLTLIVIPAIYMAAPSGIRSSAQNELAAAGDGGVGRR